MELADARIATLEKIRQTTSQPHEREQAEAMLRILRGQEPEEKQRKWHLLTLEELAQCSGHPVAVDIETNGLEWWDKRIIGIGVHCPKAGITGYMPIFSKAEADAAAAVMQAWDSKTVFIAHNVKFELHFLGLVPWEMTLWDTAVMAHLLDSRQSKALKNVEAAYLGTDSKQGYVDMVPYKQRKKIWTWPLDIVAPYCINDCIVEYELAKVMKPLLKEWSLWQLFKKDMEYIKLLWETEHRGFPVDLEFIAKARDLLMDHVGELVQELYDAVGYEFNYRSAKQLRKAIYDDMGIPMPVNPFPNSKFADRGKYNSTCTSTFLLMEKVHHPLGELIGTIRESEKLAKTLSKWLELADKNGRIHTNFNLTGTKTGRLSSSNPNIQNIASNVRTRFTQGVYTGGTERTEEYNLRNAFIAPPGYMLVGADYKQMEMRMFGILSGDPFMLKSLAAGRDIHGDIAEKIWGQRDETHREWAKTISFGLIYGMTVGSLQLKLNMTPAESNRITQDYWNAFPRIQPWMRDDVIQEVRKHNYIRYWSGRIWHEDDPEMHYRAANALIQGGCADVLSIAALRVHKWLKENIGDDAYIISYVHDELICCVPEDRVNETAKALQEIMRVEDLFDIPWLTDAKVGKTYGTVEKYTVLEG